MFRLHTFGKLGEAQRGHLLVHVVGAKMFWGGLRGKLSSGALTLTLGVRANFLFGTQRGVAVLFATCKMVGA